ncbi:MAG: N-acetylglucosamine-6-phosphate deacetylase [Alphaproteobacteria bacterium]|nr:N-acetylglucosamine-6-phosphate deacetylase [Alphaproteobacteria bacterium]
MTTPFAVQAPRLFDGETWHEHMALLVENGKVSRLCPPGQLPADMGVEIHSSGLIVPGFVDLQVNGGDGVLLNNQPDLSGISAICHAHAKLGTTAMFPTLITDTPAARDRVIGAAIEATTDQIPGFAGLHLEGPHLSIARKGAHDPALIRPMDDDDLKVLISARRHLPALLITVATEAVTPDQVRALVGAGIKISIGHSNGSLKAVLALVEAGASMVTHLYNAMSQLNSREPGLVGAALADGSLSASMIADAHHVHVASMALALKAKTGPGRIFLISDAMSTVGTDVCELVLNGRHVTRENGRLTLADGTLAGADIELATAVRVMHRQVGIELGEALRMAALYPAKAMELENGGRLGPGLPADFVWLNKDLIPGGTWVGGQKIDTIGQPVPLT